MTTSKAMHNHLVALSQKVRRKTQPNKHQHVNAGRIVKLSKVVLHSAKGTAHHRTALTANGAGSKSEAKGTGNDTSPHDTYYPQQRVELQKEHERMEEKRTQVRQKQVEFWRLYKYALEKVSNLNDLRDAPDAILPGNFPGEPKDPSKTNQSSKKETEETQI